MLPDLQCLDPQLLSSINVCIYPAHFYFTFNHIHAQLVPMQIFSTAYIPDSKNLGKNTIFFLSFHILPLFRYGNLMFLKTYDGDATDLCLSFTVSDNDFGDNKEIPLIPNGLNIEVTNANKHLYIGESSLHEC